jgi:hypothetical protein
MKLGVTMPSRTVALARVPQYARLAEQAGLDSVWNWELYRNPFSMLATSAMATDNIGLGTGLAASASRSPFEMANAAADIDELSGGRTMLGIGAGVGEFVSAFHSTTTEKPLSRVSEYIDALVVELSLRAACRADLMSVAGSHRPVPTGHRTLLPNLPLEDQGAAWRRRWPHPRTPARVTPPETGYRVTMTNRPPPAPGSLTLAEGFERSGLSLEKVWTEYLIMGGTCPRSRIADVVGGLSSLDRDEHNKLAAALNEHYVDIAGNHAVAYNGLPGDC